MPSEIAGVILFAQKFAGLCYCNTLGDVIRAFKTTAVRIRYQSTSCGDIRVITYNHAAI